MSVSVYSLVLEGGTSHFLHKHLSGMQRICSEGFDSLQLCLISKTHHKLVKCLKLADWEKQASLRESKNKKVTNEKKSFIQGLNKINWALVDWSTKNGWQGESLVRLVKLGTIPGKAGIHHAEVSLINVLQ